MDKKKLYTVITILSALIVILAVAAFFLFAMPLITNFFEKKAAEEKESEEVDTDKAEEETEEEETKEAEE
jgi:flagellar biosynthesis/type III secretory pathway M-ring protein FliF/YscJ